MDHKEFSEKGGRATSPKKTEACRKNARGPRKKAYSCRSCGTPIYKNGEVVPDTGGKGSLQRVEYWVKHEGKEFIEGPGDCCKEAAQAGKKLKQGGNDE